MKSCQAIFLAVALVVVCFSRVSEGQGCESDLMILLDASSTIGILNFNSLRFEVETFMNNTFLDYPNVRIGLIIYSNEVVQSVSLSSASSSGAVLDIIRTTPYPGGIRNTSGAIDAAVVSFTTNGRTGSPKDILLVTTGRADSGTEAVTSANNARAVGITLYAVGSEADLIGNPTQLALYRNELNQLAPNRVTTILDYSFASSLGNVATAVCKVFIIGGVNPVTVFTTETIILSVTLNQNGITGGFWSKDNVLLQANPRYSLTRENNIQRLTIVNAQLSDIGAYTYRIGDQQSTNQVTVTAGVIAYARRVISYIGQTVTLSITLLNPVCTQDGQWQLNLSPISFIGSNKYFYQISSDCRTHTMRITSVTTADTAAYQFVYNGQVVQMFVNITATSAPINGGFGPWSAWTEFQCPVTCGTSANKTIIRTRQCDSPFPQNNGANCTGPFQQTGFINCALIGCPLNGGVTAWSAWNSASVVCPQQCGTNAVKTVERRRTCTNPRPQNGGTFCTEALFERRLESCSLQNECPTPVNGGVSNWGLWTNPACSVTCGIAALKTIERFRTCTNPSPSGGGLNCQEILNQTAIINCGLRGCPVDGGVSEWEAWNTNTACPRTCGISVTKVIQRIRRCNNPPPANDGAQCSEALVQTASASCTVDPCPTGVNGGVGQWSSWNTAVVPCPVTCGVFAVKNVTRYRLCNNPPPSGGGRFCLEHLNETTLAPCGFVGCPIDGGVSAWEPWNSDSVQCPVTCGVTATKLVERVRLCNNPTPSNGGAPCSENLIDQKRVQCNLTPCPVPINGGVSLWTAWVDQGCSVTCGTAFKNLTRQRFCNNPPPSNGGIFCTQPLSDRTVVSCSLIGCPVNGGVGQWGAWSLPQCSVTCGTGATGRATRSRLCNNPPPQNNGLDCQEPLDGATFLNCNLPACPVPIDGGVSVWTAWAVPECSVSCGTSASKNITRERFCNNPFPSNGGRTCQEIGFTLSQTLTVNCGLLGCPVNGGLSLWGAWTIPGCSATCGLSEVQTIRRFRFCNNPPPQNGGALCSGNTEQTTFRSCELPECPEPVNGGFSQWSAWTTPFCPQTCGVNLQGIVFSSRLCNSPIPRNGGQDCTGSRLRTAYRTCVRDPCPVNGGLSQWAAWNLLPCSATCGVSITRTATRFRTCTNPPPSNGGRDCTGLGDTAELETRTCSVPFCPIDGGLGQWSQWSIPACGRTCGTSVFVTASRVRFCNNPLPQFGGRNCSLLGSLENRETRNCGLPACPIDGGLSFWSQWSVVSCTATCGVSVFTSASRIRTCTNPPPSDGGRNCSGLGATLQTETRNCGLPNCPIDGGFSFWSQWSAVACSASCGINLFTSANRFRTCTEPSPQFGGRDCSLLGAATQSRTQSCNLGNCPINGGLGQWSQWNIPSCSRTCGSTLTVTATRVRFCDSPTPQFGGRNCSLLGSLQERQERNCGLPACPIDGGLSFWSQWSVVACTATCGRSQVTSASRFRTCTEPTPQFGGRDCTGLGSTSQTRSQSCNLNNCPIDGVFTEWTAWNFPQCGVTCGTGVTRTVARSRTCTNPAPQFGGRDCNGNREQSFVQNCGLPSCAIDGGISLWTAWVDPPCVITCGVSATYIAYRQRFCNNPPPRDGGQNCTQSRWQTVRRNCGLPNCPVNGGVSQWAQWSIPPCSVSCGRSETRVVTRVRFCTNPAPAYGGLNCTSSLRQQEIRSCNLSPCPIDGGVSLWTQWSVPPCSRTCGSTINRRVTRVRFCNSPYPQYGGRNCIQNLFEEEIRNCNLPRCRVDGGFSLWSQWSLAACTQTCGIAFNTLATRFRTCTEPQPADGGTNCTGEYRQTTTRGCNLNPCPIDGGLTQWSQWSVPACILTCGTNKFVTAHRVRTCTQPIPRYGGRNCTGIRDQTQERSCNLLPCPIDGGLTQWSAWVSTPCSSTCGTSAFRTVTRTRSCTNPFPNNGGSGCTGDLNESEVRSCNYGNCPIDGGISLWSEWSDPPCQITCGPSARKVVTRTRVCNAPLPAFGGRACNDSMFEYEVRTCGLGNCPVDGGVTLWTQWSDTPCPVTCGNNPRKTVTRFRTCTNPTPQFGGRDCVQLLNQTTTVPCGVKACPVDGGLTQWTSWGNPPCPVTCGTAATKEVERTRSCSNPAPSNGGAECTGDVREVEIRPCNVPRCPVLIVGLCASAQRINGVGYRYHPTDCDKYLQCYYNPNGYVIGVYRSCPFGYYWDQRTLRCDHPWRVTCPLEKCDGNCIANYNLEGSCRAHWTCDKGVSRADCCPMGFRYVVGQGCRPDFYCRDTCPTPCANKDVCDKRPDWDNNPQSYNISVGLLGWLRASCVVGTYFDLLDCGCGIPSNASCRPDYSIDFVNNSDLTRAKASWLSMTDISVLSGYARFNGFGHMYVNISQKAPAIECPLIVRFRFTESQTVTSRRILAATHDCYKANSLVIALEQEYVIFEMKSVFGQTFRMPISLAGFSNFEWKTVTMVYDGKMITGVVESNNLKYMQWQYAPEMNLMECGLRFGSDGSMSHEQRFIGAMDSFTIYRCNPGGLY